MQYRTARDRRGNAQEGGLRAALLRARAHARATTTVRFPARSTAVTVTRWRPGLRYRWLAVRETASLDSPSPHTLDLIDDETERLVARAEARATLVLRRNWDTVKETADALVEQETLSGVALEAVLSTVREMPIEALDVPEDPRSADRSPR